MKHWKLPESWTRIRTVDMHTEGEPLRIIFAAIPGLAEGTMLDKRRLLINQYDDLRTMLMWEPRGHADMYGCIVTPPVEEESHFGVLFLHNEGYSTMCGHAIIAITRWAVESGLVAATPPRTQVNIDSPAGVVTAHALHANGHVDHMTFVNVPSFVERLNDTVDVPGAGTIRYDLAYGGAYYAFVDADELGLPLTSSNVDQLVDLGRRIKLSVAEGDPIVHPVEEDLGFLYGTIFTGAGLSGGDTRHVCIFADGEVDRSPTGTGVSARLAILHERAQLSEGRSIVFESAIGSRFEGEIVDVVDFHGKSAVVPRVKGRAFFTGAHEFVVDPADPWKHGFLLR